jgi:hypothetical protein
MSEFFQEDNGRFSCMRLQFFIATLAAIGFGVFASVESSDIAERLSYAFLGVAFTGKVCQKVVEVKKENV